MPIGQELVVADCWDSIGHSLENGGSEEGQIPGFRGRASDLSVLHKWSCEWRIPKWNRSTPPWPGMGVVQDQHFSSSVLAVIISLEQIEMMILTDRDLNAWWPGQLLSLGVWLLYLWTDLKMNPRYLSVISSHFLSIRYLIFYLYIGWPVLCLEEARLAELIPIFFLVGSLCIGSYESTLSHLSWFSHRLRLVVTRLGHRLPRQCAVVHLKAMIKSP